MTVPAVEARRAYWDQYYSNLTDVTRPLPSQFAIFVAGELQSLTAWLNLAVATAETRSSFLLTGTGSSVWTLLTRQSIAVCV